MSYSKTLQLVNPSIESCINTFPVELKREILSYLHIGIIVSLFEQKKRVVLYCMKMERMDRNKSFTSVFQECSVKELIDIIMITESINKKYIMRHFIDFKRQELIIKAKKQAKIVQQHYIAESLQIGDYFMSNKNINYLIVGKTKGAFKCISLGTEIETPYNQLPTITYHSPIKVITIKFTSICIHHPTSQIINNWLEKITTINECMYIKIDEFISSIGIESRGVFKKEEVVKYILTSSC